MGEMPSLLLRRLWQGSESAASATPLFPQEERRKEEGKTERKKGREAGRKREGGREGGRKERGRWREGTTKPKVLLARSSFLLACLLARAPWGGESTVTYHGVTIGMNEDGVCMYVCILFLWRVVMYNHWHFSTLALGATTHSMVYKGHSYKGHS